MPKQKHNSELPSKQLSSILNSAKRRDTRENLIGAKSKQRPNLTLQDESGSFRMDTLPLSNKSAILTENPPMICRNRPDEISIGAGFNTQLEAKRRARKGTQVKNLINEIKSFK